MIGIDPETELSYEGVSKHGHGLWPTPIVVRATFVDQPSDWSSLPVGTGLRDAALVFREDYFDPVTRIRRGRFYNWPVGSSQPDSWWVHRHPLIPDETGRRNPQGRYEKTLLTFYPFQGLRQRAAKTPRSLVVLGAADAITVWNIVSVEKTGPGGEDLVTLRARANMGFLPDLVLEDLPHPFRGEIVSAVERVVDGAHRMGGISLVDLCRDAAQTVLSAWIATNTGPASVVELDLGHVLKQVPEDLRLVRNAGDTIARLHARGKSNEARRYSSRPVADSDAQMALEAFGLILRDLRWAR